MRWFKKKCKARKEPNQSTPEYDEKRPAAESTSLPPSLPPPAQDIQNHSVQSPAGQSGQSPPAPTAPAGGAVPAVPEGVPLGLDATENAKITKIWIEVQDKVRQLAESEGKQVSPGLEIGDVIDTLESASEEKQEPPATQAVKTAFGRTMGLIKTVGGIVATGASVAFPPSGQCYNAISFLINAYDGYQGAFDGLAELLEKCSDHLGRLDYYVQGGMDTRLSRVAAEQLLLFVKICDAALQLRNSAAEKIKTGLKIAFLAENSVQDLLTEMAKLAERESRLVSAQTFKLASVAATSAAEGAALGQRILDEEKKKNAIEEEKSEKERHKKGLMDVLAFDKDPDRWDSIKQEPVESWQRRYNDIRKNVVSDTGKWLLSNPVFQSWGSDFSSSPILGVEGTDTTGKSYLASSVIKYLRTDVITQHPEFRHLIAFYFLGRGKDDLGFDAMAKSLVWQFADRDEPYMKSAARISHKVRTLDPGDIIPRLLLENTEIERMDAVFYLVIDGLGDTLDDALLKFLRQASQSKNKKIRIFLTGPPAAFEQVKKNGVACRNISISRNNSDDIEKVIDSGMNKFATLSDTDRPGVEERRKDIREKLLGAAAGDYYKLNSVLNTISNMDYMEDIDQAIKDAGNVHGRVQQIQKDINLLNRVRSPRQIKEINKIILWITFAIVPLSKKHISTLLLMIIGETLLRPLAERFQTKYLLFEVDSKGYVRFRSSKALDAIPQRRQSNTSGPRNDQEIHHGEIDIVLHFFDTVCPPELYKKLEIREYLQQKQTQKQDQIQQEDKDTAHTLLALDCLDALSQGLSVGLAVLQEYAREHLIKHLSLVDLAMVDREQKSKVGKLLVMLFTKDICIDAFMWPESIDIESSHMPRTVWLHDSQNINQVVRWFGDTAVLSGVADESERSWVENVVSGNAFDALLKPSVVRMTHHCMREPLSASDTEAIYSFVKSFLSKVSDEATRELGKSAVGFEQWAHEALQLADKDTLWHTQMAVIFKKEKFKQEAIERCELALQLDLVNWRASLYHARLVPPKEAVEMLKKVASRQERDSVWLQNPVHIEDLAYLNFELAENYWKVGDYDLAIATFAASFKQAPRRVDRGMGVLSRYNLAEKWMAIVSLFEQLAMVENKKHLGDLVIRQGLQPEIHQILRKAALATEQFGIVDTVYRAAIQRGEERHYHGALLVVRYYYGEALGDQRNRREDKIIRLWEAALWNDFPLSGLDPDVLPIFYARLGSLYLQRALAARANGDQDSVMDYLGRISGLVPEEVTQSQLLIPPQLYLARFHHVDGNDAKAQQIVRTLVQVALELLSDDDEDNDVHAFGKLLYVFIPLDDTKNALAVSGLIGLQNRSDYGQGLVYDLNIPCDGECKHIWKMPSEMWICKNCIGINLEESCLKKLQERKLERNVCNPDHDFLEVPKWDAHQMESLPKGMVRRGDQNITLDEWKHEIRKAYVDLGT